MMDFEVPLPDGGADDFIPSPDQIVVKRKPGRPKKHTIDLDQITDENFDEMMRQYARDPRKVMRCLDVLYDAATGEIPSKDPKAAAQEYLNFALGRPAAQEPIKRAEVPTLNIGLPDMGAPIPDADLPDEEQPEQYQSDRTHLEPVQREEEDDICEGFEWPYLPDTTGGQVDPSEAD